MKQTQLFKNNTTTSLDKSLTSFQQPEQAQNTVNKGTYNLDLDKGSSILKDHSQLSRTDYIRGKQMLLNRKIIICHTDCCQQCLKLKIQYEKLITKSLKSTLFQNNLVTKNTKAKRFYNILYKVKENIQVNKLICSEIKSLGYI